MDKQMILIADDQNFTRNTLKTILSSMYYVVEATNTKQAVNFMRNNSDVLDLVIFTMSIDYKELLTEKATLKRDVGLCLSVMNTKPEGIQEAKQAGIENFITYPYNENIVMPLVSSMLEETNKGRFLNSDFINQYNQMIEENIKLEKNTIGSCRIDFDKQMITNDTGVIHDICQFQDVISYTKMIETLASRLLKGRKEDYINTFSYKNISNNFQHNSYTFQRSDMFLMNTKIMYLRTKILNISNVENGAHTALFLLVDESEQYEKNRINAALYKTHYELVALIDAKDESCVIQENNLRAIEFEEGKINFDDLIREVGEKLLERDTLDDFISKVQIENVKQNLLTSVTYDVTTFASKNRMEFYQISFKYLDEFKDRLIFYVTDITAQSETDVFTDALTYHGFLNRTYDLIKNDTKKYALIYCECSNYRDICDYISVDTVVSFLKNLYGIIKTSFLNPLVIGRSLNDSFWVLVDGDIDLARLVDYKQISFEDNDRLYILDFRFGVYMLENIEKDLRSSDIDSCCERAKIACQSVLPGASKNYALFDISLRDDFIIKTSIINEIKTDKGKKEIEVFYQPIYDIKGKKIQFAEALVRWNHHQYGFIRPDLFIPYLESNGGVSEVDKVVISKVDDFLQELNEMKIGVPITVNLSRRDFFDQELVELICSISKAHEKDKNPTLAYEVTESFNIDITGNMSKVLKVLKKNNAKILLDDFGDGVSSLKALISSNFDIVKIYKGLVDEIGKNKISEAAIISTVSMCHAVGIKVIAEGVEDKRQLDFLKKAKVDYIQGYIFSKPLPKDEIIKKLMR